MNLENVTNYFSSPKSEERMKKKYRFHPER